MADQIPVVSVVIAVFNGAATLAETLASVRAQHMPDFECLIVDDGSTDSSAMIAQQFCNADDRFILIRQANQGVARARNAALAVAKGQFLAPLDADDVWHPGYLVHHVALLQEEAPDVSLSFSLAREIDANGMVVGAVSAYPFNGRIAPVLRYYNICGNPSMVVMWRNAVLAAGGYDAQLQDSGCEGSEDRLLFMRLTAAGRARAIPFYLTGYRLVENSMSANKHRMVRSALLAESLFAAEHPDIARPAKISAWQKSAHALVNARLETSAGRPLRAIRHLWSAVRHDAARTIAAALDAGLLALSGTRGRGMKHFSDLDPSVDCVSYRSLHPLTDRVMVRRLLGLIAPE